jgi:hypothetical protein
VEKESFKITGLVQDKKKEPLPGVTVLLKGTSVGVATDKDGKVIKKGTYKFGRLQ